MRIYLDLLNFLWQKDIIFCFSPNEVGIYTYVLSMANAQRWTSLVVELRDDRIRSKFAIGREALDTARARLQESGLIVFTPGNGRGKVARYEILTPVKVQSNRHLYAVKGAGKGAGFDTPLFTDADVKVLEKVPLDQHLYPLESNTGADPVFPKIEDTITGSIEPVAAAGKSGSKKGGGSPKKKRKVSDGAATVYSRCIDCYHVWVRQQTKTESDPEGFGAKIDGVQGNAMKAMITYMRTQVMTKATMRNEDITSAQQDDRVVETWQHVLNHTHLLHTWLRGRTRLVDFNSEFQNIIIQVKNELLTEQKRKSGDAGNTGKQSGTGAKGGGSVSGIQGLKRD